MTNLKGFEIDIPNLKPSGWDVKYDDDKGRFIEIRIGRATMSKSAPEYMTREMATEEYGLPFGRKHTLKKITQEQADNIENKVREKLCKIHMPDLAQCRRRCMYAHIPYQSSQRLYKEMRESFTFVCVEYRKDPQYFLDNHEFLTYADGKHEGKKEHMEYCGVAKKKYDVEGQWFPQEIFTKPCKYFKCYKCNKKKLESMELLY